MKILRIAPLVSDKALQDGITEKQVHDQLAERLGISYLTLGKLRRTTDPKYVNLYHLVVMADFFSVPVDDLVNPAYLQSRNIPQT